MTFSQKPASFPLQDGNEIEKIAETATATKRFVRCSSEFPFFPGAQWAIQVLRSGQLGRVLEVVFGHHHSSDLDPMKTANRKRQSATWGTASRDRSNVGGRCVFFTTLLSFVVHVAIHIPRTENHFS